MHIYSHHKNLINMKKITLILISVFVILSVIYGNYVRRPQNKVTNGLILLSENTGDITGYYKWEKELDNRNLKAIFKPERSVLEKYPDYFKNLASKGYEVATGYGEAPFWEMPYQEQYDIMKEYKEFAEEIIEKPIKIFSSKYFAYDENTLKAADALGIPFILARGTDLEAKVYSPKEYKAKLLFVSNLVFEDMGSGSLCDVSLFQRGSTAQDFQKILEENLNKNYQDLVLVSHVYIGGTRAGWWDAYQVALDSSKVNWLDFDSWSKQVDTQKLSYSEIPYNTEVKYTVPKPAVPLEEIELIPELKNNKNSLVVFHNGKGPMCLDFLNFVKDIDFPVEQHIEGEDNFNEEFTSYKNRFASSQGVSKTFSYYPLIFLGDNAYSGFDEDIKSDLQKQISEIKSN